MRIDIGFQLNSSSNCIYIQTIVLALLPISKASLLWYCIQFNTKVFNIDIQTEPKIYVHSITCSQPCNTKMKRLGVVTPQARLLPKSFHA